SLVSQLDVDSKFIAAIEAALGRNLHAVVLNDGGSAAEIIARLTKKKLGQAALFIPKFAAANHDSERKVLPKGALTWAIDKVAAPRSLEPLLRELLSGVVIFGRLEEALTCKKDEPTLAMATLDGEFISAEGVVFGGSSNVRSDSLLERRARVAALAKEETEYAIRRETLLQKRDQIKASVEAAGGQLDESRTHYQAAQLAHSTSTTKISLLAREEAEAARK